MLPDKRTHHIRNCFPVVFIQTLGFYNNINHRC